jgi:dTDP-4-dehydrorhamnose reductase
VNEPLTTARFAGLYGLWHPHATSEIAFEAIVFNQCRAVLLAMRAIRKRIPGARLVQTEDLGRVFSTPCLAYQAAHENERRWLSLDLLCGRVDRSHPAWRRFVALGFPSAWIDEFRGGDAAPDLLGINHYVTSDRFLDHRTSLYPARLRGGNGRDAYVDTEAARMDLPSGTTGWEARLREAWERYSRPMAVTEAHLGCVDENEQVRWLVEAWQAAQALRAEGADIRAVTAWSLFGAVDWDSMLRRDRGRYEPGVWDVRENPPRPTQLAAAVASLARTGQFEDPALSQSGWWRRDDRFHAAARRA